MRRSKGSTQPQPHLCIFFFGRTLSPLPSFLPLPSADKYLIPGVEPGLAGLSSLVSPSAKIDFSFVLCRPAAYLPALETFCCVLLPRSHPSIVLGSWIGNHLAQRSICTSGSNYTWRFGRTCRTFNVHILSILAGP